MPDTDERFTTPKNRIKDHYKLGFDPAQSTNIIIREIFQDDLARTLWLAIKSTHMASQTFDQAILIAAAEIRKRLSLTPEELLGILKGHNSASQLIGSVESDFTEELLPYVRGEKTVTYEVSGSTPSRNQPSRGGIVKVTQYMTFQEVSRTEKTVTVNVLNNTSRARLGIIKWYSPWRQYCFYPSEGCVFNAGCLGEIIKFVDYLKGERDARN